MIVHVLQTIIGTSVTVVSLFVFIDVHCSYAIPEVAIHTVYVQMRDEPAPPSILWRGWGWLTSWAPSAWALRHTHIEHAQ